MTKKVDQWLNISIKQFQGQKINIEISKEFANKKITNLILFNSKKEKHAPLTPLNPLSPRTFNKKINIVQGLNTVRK